MAEIKRIVGWTGLGLLGVGAAGAGGYAFANAAGTFRDGTPGVGAPAGTSADAINCAKGIELPKTGEQKAKPGWGISKAEQANLASIVASGHIGWNDGKYQTFQRMLDADKQVAEYKTIDIGSLGPDVDQIFGLDFQGDIPTGALTVYQPEGEVTTTRIVGIRRADVNAVQFCQPLGGDLFDVYRISEHGGDKVLDAMARLHAVNSAREHTKVVFIGDLGQFEDQWGENERPLLDRIIATQFPGKPGIGIDQPDFVVTDR